MMSNTVDYLRDRYVGDDPEKLKLYIQALKESHKETHDRLVTIEDAVRAVVELNKQVSKHITAMNTMDPSKWTSREEEKVLKEKIELIPKEVEDMTYGYRIGEKVEYRDINIENVWHTGTILQLPRQTDDLDPTYKIRDNSSGYTFARSEYNIRPCTTLKKTQEKETITAEPEIKEGDTVEIICTNSTRTGERGTVLEQGSWSYLIGLEGAKMRFEPKELKRIPPVYTAKSDFKKGDPVYLDIKGTIKEPSFTAKPEGITAMKPLIPNPDTSLEIRLDDVKMLAGTGHRFVDIVYMPVCYDCRIENPVGIIPKVLGCGKDFYQNETWEASEYMYLPDNICSRACEMSRADLLEVQRRIWEQFPSLNKDCWRSSCQKAAMPNSHYCYRHHQEKQQDEIDKQRKIAEKKAEEAQEAKDKACRKEIERAAWKKDAPRRKRLRRKIYAAVLAAALTYGAVDIQAFDLRPWTKAALQTIGHTLKDLGEK